MNVLEVTNLHKTFGSFAAVKDISFELREGEILGFLGPNGAGKTTTIQMLLGVLTPSSGSINYFGKNLQTHRTEILEQINFSSTYTNLPDWLTVKENLNFISYLYKIPNRKERVAEIVKLFDLEKLYHQQVVELSAGQLTRVNLAKAFLNSPKVLLLDEPTASLDPDVADYIRKFLLEERKKFQVSIIITSHNMAEVEEVCDRVIFINHGAIVANDTPRNLAKQIYISHVDLLVNGGMKKIQQFCSSNNLPYKTHHKHIIIDVAEQNISSFLKSLSDNNISFDEISINKPSLEDYFLQVSKTKL
jgi:ABC-2 type transport system ATP-binding protein